MTHGLLNTSVMISPEDQFVCPRRILYVTHHGIRHKQWITTERQAKGAVIRPGSLVAFKTDRRRLVDEQIIQKKQGPSRVVLSVKEYRYTDQFDESAWQIVVGRKAPCTPYPAIRTTRFVEIAEGVFPLSDFVILRA